VRRTVIVLALIVLVIAAWKLRRVELLLFGAILFGVLFDALATVLGRRLPLNRGWSLALAGLGLLALFAGAFSFFGYRVEAQIAQLIHSLPPAWAHLRLTLAQTPIGSAALRPLDQIVASPGAGLVGHLKGYAVSTGEAVLALLLMVIAGLYLAAQPEVYRDGALSLLPVERQGRAGEFVRLSGAMLRRWLWVQACAMAAVGLLTGLGLWIIGVPAPAALGLLAGVAEFVPLLGVLIASSPILLLAVTQGWTTVLWTLALLIAVHQFEGDFLQPMLQRGLVRVPPVVTLFALVGFGALFGVIGVIFAAPLAILCLAAVRTYYPRLPREDAAKAKPP
jgi:predicted PurR-regulated permease PerM